MSRTLDSKPSFNLRTGRDFESVIFSSSNTKSKNALILLRQNQFKKKAANAAAQKAKAEKAPKKAAKKAPAKKKVAKKKAAKRIR